jgi:hypothetical protein
MTIIIIKDLVEDDAMVEIEATARCRQRLTAL